MTERGPSRHIHTKDTRGVLGHAERVYIQNVDEMSARSAFGEFVAQELFPIAALNFVYGVNSGIAISSGVNGGTVTSVSGMASVDTTTTANSEAYTLGTDPIRYLPGQAITIRAAGYVDAGTSESGYAIIGCMGESFNDVLGFGTSGTTFGIFYRSFNEDIFIPQSDWNGQEKFDGSNSASAIDYTKGNVYQIRYQWLGFGDIQFDIQDPETGGFVNVHTIKYANTSMRPSLSNPSMHLGAWCDNNGDTSSALQVRAGSLGGFSAGPKPPSFADFHAATSGSFLLEDESIHNVLTIKNSRQFRGHENEKLVGIDFISLHNDSNKVIAFQLIRGAGGISGTYQQVDGNRSSVEYNTDASSTPTIPSGNILLGVLVPAADSIALDLFLDDIRVSHGETITIAAQKVGGGGNGLATAFVRWRELT